MNEPYRSILDHDFDSLSSYIGSTPQAQWGYSETGRSPAELEFHSGSGISTAIILAKHPESINDIAWSFEDLIENLIAEYSQLTLCSGWNDGIEYELWAILNNKYREEREVRMGWLSNGVKQSILEVANQAQLWVTWGESQEKPTAVNLSEWKVLFSTWQQSS